MTYREGLAIAQKYGLENEFTADYKYNIGAGDDEVNAVLEALQEWDLI